jgi:microcystin-dependent protein
MDFLASIILFGGSYAPRSWIYCQGQVLSVNQNAALFSLLSNTYGGDGRSTFGIPDLRGRVPLGTGRGNGLTEFPLGRQAGRDSVVLATENLAPHHHLATFTGTGGGGSAGGPITANATATMNVSTDAATLGSPDGNYISLMTGGRSGLAQFSPSSTDSSTLATDAINVNVDIIGGDGGGITGGTVTVENTGGNIPVSLIQPSLAMNYILCVDGSYPSRT